MRETRRLAFKVLPMLFILVWLVSGCTSMAPPYPDAVLDEFKATADVTVEYYPLAEVRDECFQIAKDKSKQTYANACASVQAGGTGLIKVPEGLEAYTLDCILAHEWSHLLRMMKLGVPVTDEQKHKGWGNQYCPCWLANGDPCVRPRT